MNATLKRNPLPAEPTWLRAEASAREVKVDRENNVLRGMVLAQEGPFKTPGRGAFNLKGLKQIKALINKEPKGIKSRFAHPTLSSDGIGKFLGRVKNPFLDVLRIKRDGEEVLVNVLRGDLHFDKTALEEPPGGGKPLGIYVMELAESDPDALSSSLVLKPQQEEQLDEKGKPKIDPKTGEPLPPLWYPLEIHASDVVDTGDAVDGILSAGLDANSLPDAAVRQGCEALDKLFPDADRETIRARLLAWVDRYLTLRFGEEIEEEVSPLNESGTATETRVVSRSVAELTTILAERGSV